MAIVRVRNNQSGDISHIGEEWLERWPDDFTLAPEGEDPETDPVEREDPETAVEPELTTDSAPALTAKPSNGTPEKKEK
jgi:hypothetical protein